jgi:hypothetical protein
MKPQLKEVVTTLKEENERILFKQLNFYFNAVDFEYLYKFLELIKADEDRSYFKFYWDDPLCNNYCLTYYCYRQLHKIELGKVPNDVMYDNPEADELIRVVTLENDELLRKWVSMHSKGIIKNKIKSKLIKK